MLKVTFKDGGVKKYKEKKYTDYWYDGKVFVVIRKKQWIGIFNLDGIVAVECEGK